MYIGVLRQRLGDHYNKGGGPIAARLWWLAFLLATFVIAVPLPAVLTGAHARKAATMSALSNLRHVGLAVALYVQDHGDRLPPMSSNATFQRAVSKYVHSSVRFSTPYVNAPYAVNRSLSLQPLKRYSNPAEIVAVWDTRLYRGGTFRAVCFLDGHAKLVSEAKWPALRVASGITDNPPAPPELPAWNPRSEGSCAQLLITFCSVGFAAVLSAFLAAWREAWRHAENRHPFRDHFVSWLGIRFVGYGFFVAVAAGLVAVLLYPDFTRCY